MENIYHPKLINALKMVVSTSDNVNKEHFATAFKSINDDYLGGLTDYLKRIEDILQVFPSSEKDKYLSVSDIKSNDDEITLCQFAIDDWEMLDRATGMRYNALVKRCKGLMPADSKKLAMAQLDQQKLQIQKISEKAKDLSIEWKKKLSNHKYHAVIANQLAWLATVTPEELMTNYDRWEKEKL